MQIQQVKDKVMRIVYSFGKSIFPLKKKARTHRHSCTQKDFSDVLVSISIMLLQNVSVKQLCF
jgi:hypothetical protein